MKDLENNKIAAAILVAGLIAMIAGKVTDVLYHTEVPAKERGYQVEVAEAGNPGASSSAQAEPIIVPLGQLLSVASTEKGSKLFKKCATCHSIESGGPHKVGPNLHNVVNKKAASSTGFAYSDALVGKNISWSYKELFAFLKKPKKFVPGTKMSFAGFKKDEDVASIILYLRENTDSKPALPAADATVTLE